MVIFSVDRTWKGVNETHVVVYTGFSEAACGYPFEAGKEYLVYAYDDTDWVTGICSLTKPLSLSKPDIEAFGKGTPPTQHVAAEELKEDRLNPFLPYRHLRDWFCRNSLCCPNTPTEIRT
ncbi:hypothetical protein HT574_09595 [Parageobacillus sp. VR-IP]|uniref:hypothetical protein n=1 Tax=Parageobacillus sp. VR-IP TaxID=2742205 RepID=UPI0015814665|nr:hypothetical protein [Parageobacillus sp. VR-IP]NUK30335.1 hypothetical protein [Parageobacillus sp. VR-IP]